MRLLGQACLFVCLMASGYAAFLSLWRSDARRLTRQIALWAGLIGWASLSITVGVLAWALVSRDFRLEYVAQYSSRLLPWHYCLSALWVGQAGSLLLWAWMMGALAMLLRSLQAANSELRDTAFGLVMGNVCFLVIVMVFAADPMAPSLIAADEGAGLSPLLQHPSMLIHPPVIFLAYSLWTVPCALALAALIRGRLDAAWAHIARPWALAAWSVLGAGLLLGAHWAYQELGWGGYWGWDPVENGSLLPWLTGTALIHSLMAWRTRDCLKKSAFALAIATCALCNFATFLTRSGIFSSVHAFSESPIGWLFLGWMGMLVAGGGVLILCRRKALVAGRLLNSVWARECLVGVSMFTLLSLTAVVLVGTLVTPVSKMFYGRMIEVGPAFYNHVLPPIGIGLVAMTAIVPLLRWGTPPDAMQRRLLAASILIGLVSVIVAMIVGARHPLALAVVGLTTLAIASFLSAWLHDAWQRDGMLGPRALLDTLRNGRRKYAAYSIHLGFICVAIGVAGSSLGTQRREITLNEGDVIEWQGHRIRYARLEQSHLLDKLVAEAVLEIGRSVTPSIELRPARHLHLLQNEWTTEVAIHSTWGGDLYTVLNAGLGDGQIALTLVSNPMMRWIWLGGIWTTASAIVAIWPTSRLRQATTSIVAQQKIGTLLVREDFRESAA